MNKFPLWKYALILTVAVLGCIYALPNIYAPDPAVQISGTSTASIPDETVLKTVKSTLQELDIAYFGEELGDKNLLVRLSHQDDQMRARREIEEALGENYIVAVNLAPTTPEWLRNMGARPMNLGLDLAGGVHFLLEVDTAKVIKDTIVSLETQLKREVRKNNLRGVLVRAGASNIRITAKTAELRDQVLSIISKDMAEL